MTGPPAGDGPGAPPGAAVGLRVVGIEKSYAGHQVLRGVSLDVARGEIVGLLGPNGAGKTVSFYAIIGLIRPDSGRVLLDGSDVTRLPMYRRIILGLGYLPQEPSIFRGLTVAQNIRAALEPTEPGGRARAAKLEALLAEFRLDHVRDLPATVLSGGERRRCEIARAVAAEPAIILLDEPFAGIDPLSILDIKTVIGTLRQRGIGIFVTDHNVREMLRLVDRAYILYDGRVLFQGTPGALIADRTVRRLYLGDDFAL